MPKFVGVMVYWTTGVQMSIPFHIKYEALELLLQGHSPKSIALNLNISRGAVIAWRNFCLVDDFSWLRTIWHPVDRNRLKQAITYWIDHPSPFGFVARKFGLRPSDLYRHLHKKIIQLPDNLKPKISWFWHQETVELMIDIPRDRPLNDREYKALKKEIQEARDQLLVAQSTWEVLLDDCQDEVKKLIESYIERTKKALALLSHVD